MARTRLFDLIRLSYRLQRSARLAGEPLLEHTERLREAYLSRRAMLRISAASSLAFAAPALAAGCGSDDPEAPVAIVGAGLAGMVCAHRLQQAGVSVEVFEAWNRTGGRTFTARGLLEGGQLCELGGELIDSNHEVMQGLAMELGLGLDDLFEAEFADTWHFEGRLVPMREIVTAFEPVAAAIAAQLEATFEVDAMGRPTPAAVAAFMRLDNTSLRAWLEDPANGASPLMRRILDVAYTGEFGRETDEQSVLNMLHLIDYETPDPFRIFGDSDERYHVHEGSSAICEALTRRYEPRIHIEHKLVAIREGAGGKLRLVFDRGGSVIEREYEQVLITIPFTTLRDVEIDVALGSEKSRLIAELQYGQNAKLMIQTSSKPWRTAMASGAGFTDNGAQTFWDSARGQGGAQGILTHFAGGNGGLLLGRGTPESQAERIAPLMDQVFPGFSAARNGRVLRMHWPSQEHFRGSYACYRPGQWSIAGFEGTTEADGRLFFAGEHCSLEFQGYMEGAAETGQTAAYNILRARGLEGRAKMLVEAGLVSSRRHSSLSARSRVLRAARAAREARGL
jgi:monoamine oxidase